MRIRSHASLTVASVLVMGCGGDEGQQPTFQEPSVSPTAAEEPAPEPAEEPATEGPVTRASEATPAPPGAEATPAATSAAVAGLYAVQVGAFVEPANAVAAVARIRAAGLPVWDYRAEVGGRTFGRVRVGVVSRLSDAARLAEIVEARLGGAVWIAPVPAGTMVPDGIEEATRRTLQGA